jgi:hypothetical protein
VYKQTLRSVKLTTGTKGKKTELTRKGPLRRRRSALDCSATEEEEEEENCQILIKIELTLGFLLKFNSLKFLNMYSTVFKLLYEYTQTDEAGEFNRN